MSGGQRVAFNENASLDGVLARNRVKNTMFTAWMEANRIYASGRLLTYTQFPSSFVYDSNNRVWNPRKKGQSVGRLTFVPQCTRELYYMRLLLNVQVGCTSFEDIRTVDGHVFDSYREACGALGLLADDREFIDALIEQGVVCSGASVRKTFANLLLCCSLGDPLNVWEQTWEIISDGILYERLRLLHIPGKFFCFSTICHIFFAQSS